MTSVRGPSMHNSDLYEFYHPNCDKEIKKDKYLSTINFGRN